MNTDSITQNLENLFIENYTFIKKQSLENIINNYINETNLYYKSMGITNYLQDEEVIQLKKVSKNKTLQKSFEEVIKIDLDENKIVNDLIFGIKNGINDLKQKIQSQKEDFHIQLIFIIHDQLLSAGFYCYGEGNFPILKRPNDFYYDYEKTIYNENNFIDYSVISCKLNSFDLLIEELEIDNFLMETTFYQSLLESYKFKIYLLLNKAFENIATTEFNGISIKLPLYIYAKEHDCSPINIFLYQ